MPNSENNSSFFGIPLALYVEKENSDISCREISCEEFVKLLLVKFPCEFERVAVKIANNSSLDDLKKVQSCSVYELPDIPPIEKMPSVLDFCKEVQEAMKKMIIEEKRVGGLLHK